MCSKASLLIESGKRSSENFTRVKKGTLPTDFSFLKKINKINKTMDEKDVSVIVESASKSDPVSQEASTVENKIEVATQNELKESTTLSNNKASVTPPIYNRRALLRTAETYELEKFEKNSLLILNQKDFTDRSTRLGTEKDVRKLNETFSKFGFEVKAENNLKHGQIMQKLEEFSSQDFTDYGCVAVAVLTHGAEGGLIRAKDKAYNESEIIKHFKVNIRPTLVTKPRILIIQACRGKQDHKAVTVFGQRGPTKKDVDEKENEKPYTLPVESDMLVLHSSYIGKPSHRDELNGSWFIQVLCEQIDGFSKTRDLESILTEVKRVVAIDLSDEEHNTITSELEVNKQMPVITSTLIRKLYLRSFGELPVSLEDAGNITMGRYLSAPGHGQSDCGCFLEHFAYMRNCLKYYLEVNSDDSEAQAIYELASTYDNNTDHNEVKKEMLCTITEYFNNKCVSFNFHKFLHLYNTKS